MCNQLPIQVCGVVCGGTTDPRFCSRYDVLMCCESVKILRKNPGGRSKKEENPPGCPPTPVGEFTFFFFLDFLPNSPRLPGISMYDSRYVPTPFSGLLT